MTPWFVFRMKDYCKFNWQKLGSPCWIKSFCVHNYLCTNFGFSSTWSVLLLGKLNPIRSQIFLHRLLCSCKWDSSTLSEIRSCLLGWLSLSTSLSLTLVLHATNLHVWRYRMTPSRFDSWPVGSQIFTSELVLYRERVKWKVFPIYSQI